jgi:hypothetical protein
MQALMLSIAFVLQMTLGISTPKERKGTDSAQVSNYSFTIAGYVAPQDSWNSRNRSVAASSLGAVQTGLRALATLSQS